MVQEPAPLACPGDLRRALRGERPVRAPADERLAGDPGPAAARSPAL